MKIRTLIFCFLAATVFWLMNALNKSGHTTTINYPIEFLYNEAQYIPITPLPKQIKVNISSTGWDLLKNNFSFDTSPIQYKIENPLSVRQINTTSLKELISAKLTRGKLNFIESDTLFLNFDKRIIRKVAIKVDSAGIDLDKKYVVASLINITPNEVALEGPESLLKTYPNEIILKIPAKRLATNFDDKLLLEIPQNNLIKANTKQAKISFEVAELLNQ